MEQQSMTRPNHHVQVYDEGVWERYKEIRATIKARNPDREVINTEVVSLLLDAWERCENGQGEVAVRP